MRIEAGVDDRRLNTLPECPLMITDNGMALCVEPGNSEPSLDVYSAHCH